MSVVLGPSPQRRRLSLTPMIDVVFLLLVFFMLAAQFGGSNRVPLMLGSGGSTSYSGPPRLVEIFPSETRLNGVVLEYDDLIAMLEGLTYAPDDMVVLRAGSGATIADITATMGRLRASGFVTLVLVE